jgi:hypothetical protein
MGMKNKIIIGIIILFVCVGLSGCNQQNNYKIGYENKLVIDFFKATVLTHNLSQTVLVDASAYNAITNNISYEISLGENVMYNGKVTPVMAYGPTCTHTYYKWEKNYTIHLIVRDDKGNVNTSSRTIRIEVPPVEPVYVEHHTNLPEMNGITYDELSTRYGITSIS